MTAATITEADVRSFQKAVAESDGRVFAHCRSGIRSASLHAIGEVLDGRLARKDLPELGGQWGIDLSVAAKWLARDAEPRPRVSRASCPASIRPWHSAASGRASPSVPYVATVNFMGPRGYE